TGADGNERPRIAALLQRPAVANARRLVFVLGGVAELDAEADIGRRGRAAGLDGLDADGGADIVGDAEEAVPPGVGTVDATHRPGIFSFESLLQPAREHSGGLLGGGLGALLGRRTGRLGLRLGRRHSGRPSRGRIDRARVSEGGGGGGEVAIAEALLSGGAVCF